MSIFARSRESLGEGAAQPALLLVVIAAGRAGTTQRVQGRHAIRGQLSRHRYTLMMIVAAATAGAAGGTRFGVA